MKNMFKMVSTGLGLLIAAGLIAGCDSKDTKPAAAPAVEKKVEAKVIKAGIGLNDQSPQDKGLLKFKEILEAESKGRYEVNLFASSQLGDDTKMMTSLRAGTLEMTCPSTAPIAGLDKKWMVFDRLSCSPMKKSPTRCSMARSASNIWPHSPTTASSAWPSGKTASAS